MRGEPEPWSILARNLPEHARNPIHTDEGARAEGFERALVAGVTSYAYCCHPVIDRLGLEWVAAGEAEVRFRSPVFDGDRLHLPITDREDGGLDVAVLAARLDAPLVEMAAWPVHRGAGVPGTGEALRTISVELSGEYGSDYAARSGDDASVCADAGVVHPAVWPALANTVFHAQLARGPWVHTRSIVRHRAAVPEGAWAEVSTVVIRRFHRHGERVVAEITVRVAGAAVATIEHEAIVDLTPTAATH